MLALNRCCNPSLVNSLSIRRLAQQMRHVADNFFGSNNRQKTSFDIQVFNPFASSHRNSTLNQCYRQAEQEKRRAYDERVTEVEHGSFTPLVFLTAGGLEPAANEWIASIISEKEYQNYSKTLFWLRCKLGFSLLRSAVMCLRGSRSFYHHPQLFSTWIGPACLESRIC